MVLPVFSHTKSCKTANSSIFPVTKLTSSGRIFWERWIRIHTDRGVKVIISGSSSKLLSSEVATLLTGRQISFHVHPFSFRGFMFSQGQSLTFHTVKVSFPECL
ncbi:MAG: ATP-binding protein [Deltaproteobacteria bacterium]|nr:ATP-binding protein [Deltaproteobacteria bacterium]